VVRKSPRTWTADADAALERELTRQMSREVNAFNRDNCTDPDAVVWHQIAKAVGGGKSAQACCLRRRQLHIDIEWH